MKVRVFFLSLSLVFSSAFAAPVEIRMPTNGQVVYLEKSSYREGSDFIAGVLAKPMILETSMIHAEAVAGSKVGFFRDGDLRSLQFTTAYFKRNGNTHPLINRYETTSFRKGLIPAMISLGDTSIEIEVQGQFVKCERRTDVYLFENGTIRKCSLAKPAVVPVANSNISITVYSAVEVYPDLKLKSATLFKPALLPIAGLNQSRMINKSVYVGSLVLNQNGEVTQGDFLKPVPFMYNNKKYLLDHVIPIKNGVAKYTLKDNVSSIVGMRSVATDELTLDGFRNFCTARGYTGAEFKYQSFCTRQILLDSKTTPFFDIASGTVKNFSNRIVYEIWDPTYNCQICTANVLIRF